MTGEASVGVGGSAASHARLAPARKEAEMSDSKGRFVWYELMTTDPAAAREFYGKVVGWQAKDAAMPEMQYTMFHAGDTPVAGLMALPEEARKMGAPPHWMGYVGVENVDAATTKVTAKGGSVRVPPTDIPNMGRFAVVADPHGAGIALYQGTTPENEMPASQEGPGHVGWHELYAGELGAAHEFYSELFGWQKKDAMDMGEMGVYQMFGAGDTTLGGMMTKTPETPVPYWNYYFNVGNIDEAAERVKAAGGQIMFGPSEVPGGGYIIMGLDPQGAAFSLVGKR
jgi:predicted enzyme related to lactoylglutathione lyase